MLADAAESIKRPKSNSHNQTGIDREELPLSPDRHHDYQSRFIWVVFSVEYSLLILTSSQRQLSTHIDQLLWEKVLVLQHLSVNHLPMQ